MNPDNTIALENRILQIEKSRWRHKLAACTVTVHEFLDGRMVVRFGPHVVAPWSAEQLPAPRIPRAGSARPLGQRKAAA